MIGVCQQRPEREVKEGQGPLVMMTKVVRMTKHEHGKCGDGAVVMVTW